MLKSIGVIGLGKLGLPLAILFTKHFKVYGVDVNSKRILQILNREKFFEPQLNEYLQKYGDRLQASTDYSILKDCEVVFILIQTPSLANGKFDSKYVESGLTELHKINPDCLAVVSSTINIGDMNKLKQIHSRMTYNPEFIKQGSIIHDFLNPKFVLVGTYNQQDGEIIKEIWHKFHCKPVHIVKPTEAEIIKLSLNVNFTLGITFANMIGELCENFDADSNRVLDIIYKDRRNYKAGLGFMGPCFPRDVNCFRATCFENALISGEDFANLLNSLNEYTVEKYIRKIKSFGKKKVGILGLAYKPNVPYIYESQPLKIAEELIYYQYEVYVYDKFAKESAKEFLPKECFCDSAEECIKKADVIFIGTKNYSNIETDKPVVNPWR